VEQILKLPPTGFGAAWLNAMWPGSRGYLGAAMVLGLAAVPARESRSVRLAFLTLGLLTWAMTTGVGPIFHAFLYLPTADWFRFPPRLFTLTTFAFATLSAFAVQDALEARSRALVPIAIVTATFLVFVAIHPTGAWYSGAAGGLLVALALAKSFPARTRLTLAGLVPALLLLESLTTTPNPIPAFDKIASSAGHHRDLIDFLHESTKYERVHLRHRFDNSLPVKSAMLNRLYADFDYEPFMPGRTASYWQYLINGDPSGKDVENGVVHLTAEAAHLRLLDYLGTRFIVESPSEQFLTWKTPPEVASRYKRVLKTADGYSVVENLHAKPRASVVARTELSPPGEPLLARLADPSFPARGTALVEDPKDVIDAPSAHAGTGYIVAYTPESAEIEVEAISPGMFVFTDTFYPGWEATLNGEPVEIVLVNHLFRGVKVPAGKHVVRFDYRPKSFYAGVAISLVGLLAFAMLLAFGRGTPVAGDVAARS
jgi:hypothetical protein